MNFIDDDVFYLNNKDVDIVLTTNINSIVSTVQLDNLDIILNNKRKWNILDLKNNNITNDLEIHDLECNKLILSKNNISNIVFSNCNIDELVIKNSNLININFINTNIIKLNISHNKLTLLSFPNNLEFLDASNNYLEKINFLPNNISFLNLSCNNITEITCMPINIMKFEIFENKLTYIDPKLLDRNFLNYVDITENNLENIKELEKLDFETYYTQVCYSDNESVEPTKQNIVINISDTDSDFDDIPIISKNKDKELDDLLDYMLPTYSEYKQINLEWNIIL